MPLANNIETPFEVDAYEVQLQANTPYTAIASGAETSGGRGTLPDPFVGIGNLSTGEVIAVADIGPEGGKDPFLTFQVPVTGSYILAVGDVTGGTGTYATGVFDPQNNLQTSTFVTDVVVDAPTQNESVGLTGLPDSDFPAGMI